eukprot:TRINITY_DN5018_c0_g1_i3.p1 TRINITY_DN5018_c0_g1~~TRINITY_DN5018_c0_g1_i3.p1  ORF type:complete len:219 (+),score=50.33 TRINITY_DN5018_c0_g1_i3:65-721(+)
MCIRDSINAEYMGFQEIKRHTMSVLNLLIIFSLAVSVLSYFDRCDPKWVKIIQNNQLYDCASPTNRNPRPHFPSAVTQFANLFKNFNVKVEGKEATPETVFNYLRGCEKNPNLLIQQLKKAGFGYQMLTDKKSFDSFVNSNFSKKNTWVSIISADDTVNHLEKNDKSGVRTVIDSRGRAVTLDKAAFSAARGVVVLTKLQTSSILSLSCLQLFVRFVR